MPQLVMGLACFEAFHSQRRFSRTPVKSRGCGLQQAADGDHCIAFLWSIVQRRQSARLPGDAVKITEFRRVDSVRSIMVSIGFRVFEIFRLILLRVFNGFQ